MKSYDDLLMGRSLINHDNYPKLYGLIYFDLRNQQAIPIEANL